MTVDRSFVESNRASRERIRNLVARLSDEELSHPVGEHWTVAVALVHLAFWDRRVMALLDAAEREGKLVGSDMDIVVNDISLPLWLAVPPREATRIVIETADKLDQRLESFPPDLLEEVATYNIRYVERSRHRTEHLDDVEEALKS